MKLFILDSLFLMILSLPVVLQYKILPAESTPYWLFGIYFLLLLINVVISLYSDKFGNIHTVIRYKTIILWTVMCLVVGSVLMTAILDRAHGSPMLGVHDIILQEEAAIRYLIQGKNPYKETYFGTPVEQFHYEEVGSNDVNPALYHFVMPPWYLLFPLFFYVITVPLFGFFDARFASLFAAILLMLVLTRWFKNKSIGSLAAVITLLSPATINYFIEGRSDIFALSWLVFSLYLLEKKHILISSLIFGLAILSKQTIWFSVPFYFMYVYKQSNKQQIVLIKSIFTTGIVVGIFVLPFLIWDARAFFDSVIIYLSGGTKTGYPVSGYGLGMVLYSFGIIHDRISYYPFILWQLILGIPICAMLIVFMSKYAKISRLIISYAITLSVIWYTSRYFNNSHLSFLSSLFAIGVLKHLDEQTT